MGIAHSTFKEIIEANGGKVVPLSSYWGDAANDISYKIQEQKRNKQRELFYIENNRLAKIDEQSNIESDHHQGMILILIKQENGYYSSMWADPNDPYDLALMVEDYDGAFNIARERLAQDPFNSDLLFDKAYALDMLGNDEKALYYYNQVLHLDPENAAALNNKALILEGTGNHVEALACHKRAVDFAPDSALNRLNYANALYRSGDMQGYYAQLEETLKITDPAIDDQLHIDNFMESTGIHSLDELRRKQEEDEAILRQKRADAFSL